MRFRNVPSKIVIVYSDNERHGTAIAKVIAEKGFTNVYLLTGGISQWALHHKDLVRGDEADFCASSYASSYEKDAGLVKMRSVADHKC